MTGSAETGYGATSFMRDGLLALLAVVTVAAASGIGGASTYAAIPTWYAGLDKPPFNPPNWVFSPVWTALYAMMAFAFWRILRLRPGLPGRKAAIGWFLVQMALNALWSVAFFGLRWPEAGIAVIVALWLAIAATMRAFWPLDRFAGWLLAPYLAWVSFAAALNVAIAWLN